jgi:protein required for attachment to host cells
MKEESAMQQSQRIDSALLVLASRRHARLVRCQRLTNGRIHLDVLTRTEEAWDQARHANPPSRSDAAGHVFDNRGHQPEERVHRFAREVVHWLEHVLPKDDTLAIALAAEPAMLGALRAEAPKRLRERWVEHAVDLEVLSEAELAQRREVIELLTPAAE